MLDILILSVKEVSVRLRANDSIISIIQKNQQKLRAIIPELRIVQSVKDQSYHYTIELNEASIAKLILSKNALVYDYDIDQFEIDSFAYTILTNVFSQLLFERNKLFVHASIIDQEGIGYALFGRGKTSSVILLGKNEQLKIIAEDNAILDLGSLNITGNIVSYNLFKDGMKKRISHDDIDIATSVTTNLKYIFYLSNQYNVEGLSKLKGFEKSSIICSFVNERLFNHSRWNNNLKMVPDFRIREGLEMKRDEAINKMIESVDVIRLESSIQNYPKLINKYLGL
jgi:hypothetical protein